MQRETERGAFTSVDAGRHVGKVQVDETRKTFLIPVDSCVWNARNTGIKSLVVSIDKSAPITLYPFH